MAQLSKPPIPVKMYKHFAVVTVVMTGAIAMFADDGNREAVSDHVAARQEQERLRERSREITSPPTLARNDLANPAGGFGSEGGDFGAPMAMPGGTGGGTAGARRRHTPGSARLSVPGYDQAWIDALSEEQYRIFLDAISPEQLEGAQTGEQRREAQTAVEAASARRAGRFGRGRDAPPD